MNNEVNTPPTESTAMESSVELTPKVIKTRTIDPTNLPAMNNRMSHARSKRSKKSVTQLTRPISISLSMDETEYLRALGKNNVTEGVRILIKKFKEAEKRLF
jgi:hypothetical protein